MTVPALQSVQTVSSVIHSQATTAGGTLGLGTFLRAVIEGFRQLAYKQIDTEAERDAIKDALLALADLYVAPKFPFGWKITRQSVDWTLDEYMDHLPVLLGEVA